MFDRPLPYPVQTLLDPVYFLLPLPVFFRPSLYSLLVFHHYLLLLFFLPGVCLATSLCNSIQIFYGSILD